MTGEAAPQTNKPAAPLRQPPCLLAGYGHPTTLDCAWRAPVRGAEKNVIDLIGTRAAQSSSRNARSSAGVTVVELVVAMAVTLVLSGAVFGVVNAVQRLVAFQPEVNAMQQGLRTTLLLLANELVNAGAGLDRTTLAGPLVQVLPPVVPYRRGQVDDDGRAGVTFRSDALSLVYVAGAAAQAPVLGAADDGARLTVDLGPNCGALAPTSLCGFVKGMRALVLDPTGAHDFVTVEDVAGSRVRLVYRGSLASRYSDGRAVLAHAAIHSYALRTDPATGTPQLAHYDGFVTDLAAVDHVAALSFEYFGEPEPPRLRATVRPAENPRPWTTYGPAPPALGVDDAATSWGPGENCVFAVDQGAQVPRLASLGPPGGFVALPGAVFGDGPWCPDDQAPRRYDADLLRIRRVRIRVRVEAAARAMRGLVGNLFLRGGAASFGAILAPDQAAVLDITPRSLSAGR